MPTFRGDKERKLYGLDWGDAAQISAPRNFFPPLALARLPAQVWAMAGTLPDTTGDASREPRSTAFLPEHVRVVGRMTRPPERRPAHDTIDNIADWLLESPRQLSEGIASFDEFAWRLLATGMPLLRVTRHTAASAIPRHRDHLVARHG